MEPQQYHTDSMQPADRQQIANPWPSANAVGSTNSFAVSTTQARVDLPSQPTGTPTTASYAATAPVVAEDADLIENEWVLTVKAVIEENKKDPYNQSKAITA